MAKSEEMAAEGETGIQDEETQRRRSEREKDMARPRMDIKDRLRKTKESRGGRDFEVASGVLGCTLVQLDFSFATLLRYPTTTHGNLANVQKNGRIQPGGRRRLRTRRERLC
jgi:hypothetical protein